MESAYCFYNLVIGVFQADVEAYIINNIFYLIIWLKYVLNLKH